MIKNLTKLFFSLAFVLISFASSAQNVRGFYLQDVGDWLGNQTKENEILAYAQGNGFNYILFYDLGDINWNSSTEKNQLAAFMTKARSQYGITQIGGVVEYAGYVSQKLIPYNNTRTNASQKFDVINLEFEFWVNSSISSSYCSKFLSAAGFSCDTAGAWKFAWREFKIIDDLCANNGMISEFYMGWPNKGQLQQIASRADRILLSAYRPTDSDIYLYSKNRMKDIATIGGSTKILTLLSSETSFMGPWLNSHPQNKPYQTINAALAAETMSFKNNIDLQGYQWFTYRYMPKTMLATANITAGGPLTFCPGGSVTLTANSGASYLWSPSGQTTQSITVSGAGSYSVRVTSTNGTAVMSSPVTVSNSGSGSTPVITASGSTSFCPGGSVTLTANTASSYNWSNGATTQSITVSNSGTYTVNTGGGSCSGTSAPVTVSATSAPSVPVVTASGPLSICPGTILTLTSTQAGGYLWSNGATTRSISVSSPGSYSVSAFNGPNCSASSTANIVTLLTAPVVPTVTANGSLSLSSSHPSVQLTSSVASAYLWNSNATTRTVTVNSMGNYRVTVTGSNGCKSSSNDVMVSAGGCTPPLIPLISLSGPSVIFNGQLVTLTSTVSGGYLWSNGATTRSITVSTPGIYTVRSYNKGGCFSTSLPVTIVTMLPRKASENSDETAGEIKIEAKVYPNPVRDLLNIEFNNVDKDVLVKLFDITGKEIMSQEVSHERETKAQFEVSSLPKGIYMAGVFCGDQKTMIRVIVD